MSEHVGNEREDIDRVGSDAGNGIDERVHQLLCAHLFGECTPEERAEIESALARSPALRDERVRLAATVGLVRESYGDDERMSDATVAALVERASARGPRALPRWRPGPALRAAAGVLVLAGGVLGLLKLQGSGRAPDEIVARGERPRPAAERMAEPLVARADSSDASKSLDALTERGEALDGVDLGAGEESVEMPREGRSQTRVDRQAAGVVTGAGHDDVAAAEEPPPETLTGAERPGEALGFDLAQGVREQSKVDAGIEVGEALRLLDQGQVDPSQLGSSTQVFELDNEAAFGEPNYTWRDTSLLQQELGQLESLGYSGGETKQDAPAGAPAIGVGRAGQRSNATPEIGNSEPPQVGLFRSRHSDVGSSAQKEGADSYKGASDTVAPGQQAALELGARARQVPPSTPGPSGPSSPAPGSPSPAGSAAGAPSGGAGGSDAYLGGIAAESDSVDDLIASSLLAGEKDAQIRLYAYDDDGLAGHGDLDEQIERWRAKLSREDRERLAERCAEDVLTQCRPHPRERPRDMYFRFWGDNPFELAQLDALSTFAADVDTASYALARRYLVDGHLPEKAQVRTEEFVNYFAPDLAPPTEDVFAISTELAPSLFGGAADRWLLRVGVRAREVSKAERKPLSIVFVVDTSGSMAEQNRLELVKHAMRLLVGELDARDEIGVVAFASDARLVLPVTSVTQRGLIESAIHPLRPEGSTNAAAGLRMGYELALGALDNESVSRVVLLSDGVANTGETDQQRILESVRAHRERGIYLNTIGVGMNNHNDVLLEQLADKGDGVCDYVDSEETARRAIVERFTGAFEPVASDVKIQVEFDPAQVYRWRQLGYENRAVADQDFRNDAVDAGEIGAGHQVVALYEIERVPSAAPTGGAASTAETAGETPLATVRLRWKAPKSATTDPREPAVTEREAKVLASQAIASYDAASYGYRRAVLAAQLAEFLRRSTHTEHDRYSELVAAASRLVSERDDAETRELAALIQRAADLVLAAHRERFELRSELDRVLDEYRRKQCLRAELECFDESETRALLENVQRQSAELEQALRDLIRRRLCEERG